MRQRRTRLWRGRVNAIMPFDVYVLRSEKDSIRYVGSGADAAERLRRHNKGDYKFTKGHMPWKLIYKEEYNSRSEAVKRERFLKSGQGRKYLDEVLKSSYCLVV